MTFFARPNLDNVQFKQLEGTTSILTLSGQTQIATTSGLTLTDGVGGYVPIIATGGTNNAVLTYKSGRIILLPTSASTGSGVYSGASPTTCPVGGLCINTSIANCSISKIIEMIVAPVVSPTCTPNFLTFSLTPSTSVPFEKGQQISFTTNATYNQGSVSPIYYSGTSVRTGLPVSYNYTSDVGSTCTSISTSLSDSVIFPSHPIQDGCFPFCLNVSYSAGQYPKKSDGSTGGTTCCAANTLYSCAGCIPVCGLYPYFWGVCTCPGPAGASRPVGTCAMVLSGTKVINSSSGDITINFNSGGSDYLWFAIPSNIANKTCWCCNSSLYGTIGGGISPAGNLFPAPDYENIPVTSASPAWTCNYDIYISNKQTSTATLKMGYA